MNMTTTAKSGAINYNSANTISVIGSRSTYSNGEYADAKIRDLRVYDYTLSDEQAASLYSGSYNVTPVVWWKLDENSGTTATDTGTAASNHGTFVNSPVYSDGTMDVEGVRVLSNGAVN